MKFEIAPKSTEIQANWDDARLYCFSLNIDGKVGWRLPAKEELNQIYKSMKHDFARDYYWSSTEFGDYGAWYQNFNVGYQNFSPNKNESRFVRAIRNI